MWFDRDQDADQKYRFADVVVELSGGGWDTEPEVNTRLRKYVVQVRPVVVSR